MRTATTILVLLALVCRTTYGVSNVIKIGAIFHAGSEEDQQAFQRAVEFVRINHIAGQYILEPVVKIVTLETDSIETRTKACDLLAEGVAAIFGPKSQYTKPIVASIAAHHGVPHIEYSWRPIEESILEETTINVYPASKSIAKTIASMVQAMPWTRFTAIYETNDGLSRLQEALKLHGPNDHPVTVRQLGEGSDHRPLLKEIAASREVNIIIDVEPENLIEVMRQADEVKLMKDYHNWIVSDLDLPSCQIPTIFKESKVNITGFGLLTEKERQLASDLGLESVKLESALLYDAVLLFHRALDTISLANPSSESRVELEPVSLQCESDEKYLAGQHLMEAMRSMPPEKLINETTGPMQFDETGQRTAFRLQLLEFNTDKLKEIGYYDNDRVTITRSEKDREADVAKKITTSYRVTSRLGPPYLMEAKGISNITVEIGDKRYEGYSVDLIHAIALSRNFSYTFELVPDGNYGSYNDVNKSWDGLIKRLLDHEADLAICDLTINHQRETAVDFTMPFMNLGISILYIKPPIVPPELFSFLHPFSTEVWIYVATAYLGVSVMLFLLARIAPGEWDNPHPCNPDPEELENSFNLMNSMWLTIGSLMQQGSDILPKAPSIRMVAGMWWFFTLIMVSSYTANLAAFLTTGKMGDTITNVDELAAQTKIKYGTLEGGSTSMFFKESNHSVYQRMWAAMNEAKPSVFTKTNAEGVERVLKGKRGYAFFMESTSIEYNVARECELVQIGGLLDSKGYGIAMPPKSAYRTTISKAVLELQERGELKDLKAKWWADDQKKKEDRCDDGEKKEDSNELELRLANVGGVFLVLLCGCAASLVVGILEFLWNVRKVAVEEKITPREALIAEFKFAINIWAETKPVKVASSRDSSTAHDGGGIGRAASVARSMVGSFLRLDMLDKFEKDNVSNNKSGKRRSK